LLDRVNGVLVFIGDVERRNTIAIYMWRLSLAQTAILYRYNTDTAFVKIKTGKTQKVANVIDYRI